MSTSIAEVDDRKLRIINGESLTAAIAQLADQLEPGKGAAFALIAALWKGLPAEAVTGIVHLAAAKVGPVEQRELFRGYRPASLNDGAVL